MSLKGKTVTAMRWATISSVGRIVLQVIQLVVLARLLTAFDFGTMAIVTATFSIINTFPDYGVGRTLVHYKNISQIQLSSLFWVNFCFSLFMCMFIFLVSDALGRLYNNERLPQLIVVASLVFPILALGFQHRVLAEKQLRFRTLALIEISSSLIGVTTAVVVAMNDGGVWSFVAGMLVQALGLSVLTMVYLTSDWRPNLLFSIRESSQMLRFGAYSISDALLNMLRFQADILIAGLFTGPSQLGLYSFARDIVLKTGPVIGQILNRVSFPLMSIAREDIGRLQTIYLLVVCANCSIIFPIYLFVAAYSSELVELIFGASWAKSADVLMILALYGLFRAIIHPVGSLLYATGNVKLSFTWNLILAILLPLVLLVATISYGIYGLAYAQVIFFALLILPSWYYLVRSACGATLPQYLQQLIVPVLISLVSILPILAITRAIDLGFNPLLVSIPAAVLSYLLLSTMFNKPLLQHGTDLLRR